MNTINFIKQQLSTCSNAELRSELYQLYIKSISDTAGRVILYPGQRGANVVGKINNECNGLVLYINKFDTSPEAESKEFDAELLAVPVQYARNSNQVNTESILKGWNENTKIYARQGGTYITLYYFGKWTIATSKGIDMNNVCWRTKTYEEMLNECLVEQGGWNKFTKSLDPEYSYAACFIHDDIHIFATENKFMLQNMVRLSDGVDIINTDNEKYLDLIRDTNIVSEVPDTQFDINQNPTDKLRGINSSCASAYSEFNVNKTMNFGYVVRFDEGDILFESSLQKVFNDLYYHNSYTQDLHMTSYERHKYVLLVNYLSQKSELFIKLFPQFRPDFDNFAACLGEILEAIKNIYQSEKQFTKRYVKKGSVTDVNKKQATASEIKKNIDRLMVLNVDAKHFESKVMSLLYAPVNFDAVYRYIFN